MLTSTIRLSIILLLHAGSLLICREKSTIRSVTTLSVKESISNLTVYKIMYVCKSSSLIAVFSPFSQSTPFQLM